MARDETLGSFFAANVAGETRGRWGAVHPVSLPAGARASEQITQLTFVSCPSVGRCVAVGQYVDSHGSFQGMHVAESDGVWQRAGELALPANANPTAGDGTVDLVSVSCPSPGNCVAVGSYGASTTPSLAMATTETHGVWGRAVQIKLPTDANTTLGHEIASMASVTCTSASDCVATGQYNDTPSDATDDAQPMIVTETDGRWARAIRINTPAQATTAQVGFGSIACASRGNCIALGADSQGIPVMVKETRGRWARATLLPTPRGAGWAFHSVSCRAASCVAVGGYESATGSRPMVATVRNGTWGSPHVLPLPRAAVATIANNEQDAYFSAVSCTDRDNCTAIGQYDVPYGPPKLGYTYPAAMAAVESHGHWSTPAPLTLSPNTHNTASQ